MPTKTSTEIPSDTIGEGLKKDIIKVEKAGSNESDPLVTGVEAKRTAFQLKYKVRQVEGLLYFWMPTSDLAKAIERGREHCQIQNYRFIWVHYFFTDLDAADAKRKSFDLS